MLVRLEHFYTFAADLSEKSFFLTFGHKKGPNRRARPGPDRFSTRQLKNILICQTVDFDPVTDQVALAHD